MTTEVPALIVVTDRHAAERSGRSLRDVIAAVVNGGAPAVLYRDRDLADPERRELGETLQPVVTAAEAQLFVSADVALARHLDAAGVHLPAGAPAFAEPGGLLVGRSCHGDVEVAAARDEGADYAFVSPVAESSSKPGYGPALGETGLRRLVAVAEGLPLLALGGVTPENTARWRAVGASGIAVMGSVMAARDPAEMVRRLLAAWNDPAHAENYRGAMQREYASFDQTYGGTT